MCLIVMLRTHTEDLGNYKKHDTLKHSRNTLFPPPWVTTHVYIYIYTYIYTYIYIYIYVHGDKHVQLPVPLFKNHLDYLTNVVFWMLRSRGLISAWRGHYKYATKTRPRALGIEGAIMYLYAFGGPAWQQGRHEVWAVLQWSILGPWITLPILD